MADGAVRHTPGGGIVTELILQVFRLNGRLLAAGDRLTEDIGLTSARWQVIGAIALAGAPQPAAHLARNMGLTRQAVQRTLNELEAAGLVAFAPNPHHRRAQLVVLTKAGQASYAAALARQVPWANRLAIGLRDRDLTTTTEVLRALTERLEAAEREPVTRRRRPTRTGPATRARTHAQRRSRAETR